MDSAVVEHQTLTPSRTGPEARRRPPRAEAEAAVRTLIEWAGDDPDREGLRGTRADSGLFDRRFWFYLTGILI